MPRHKFPLTKRKEDLGERLKSRIEQARSEVEFGLVRLNELASKNTLPLSEFVSNYLDTIAKLDARREILEERSKEGKKDFLLSLLSGSMGGFLIYQTGKVDLPELLLLSFAAAGLSHFVFTKIRKREIKSEIKDLEEAPFIEKVREYFKKIYSGVDDVMTRDFAMLIENMRKQIEERRIKLDKASYSEGLEREFDELRKKIHEFMVEKTKLQEFLESEIAYIYDEEKEKYLPVKTYALEEVIIQQKASEIDTKFSLESFKSLLYGFFSAFVGVFFFAGMMITKGIGFLAFTCSSFLFLSVATSLFFFLESFYLSRFARKKRKEFELAERSKGEKRLAWDEVKEVFSYIIGTSERIGELDKLHRLILQKKIKWKNRIEKRE